MKKTISLCLFCLLFISAHAQKNMQEGFIVLNNNDTLKGSLNYHEWYTNPKSILFSRSKTEGTRRYTVKDISCFNVTGREMYQRHYVRISMDKRSIGNIGEKDTSSRTDTVFLKVILSGNNVTLLSYADNIKPRLYILPADEATPVELQNSEYLLNGQMVSENQYRTVLLSICRRYIAEDNDARALIYSQNYSQKAISDICYRINGTTPTAVMREEKSKLSHFRFFAGAGVNQGSLSFKGNNHYTGKTGGATYGPVIGGGADILVNPAVGRMFLRSQLSFSQYKTEAYTFEKYFEAKKNYYFKMKQTNIALHEMLSYNVYNGQLFKWFVGAGAGFNFSSYPLNEEKYIREGLSDTSTSINNNYIAYHRKFWLNASFMTGFALRNVEATFVYHPKASISQISGYELDNSSLQLQINYLFY